MAGKSETFDPEQHISAAEMRQILGQGCPCSHPDAMSYNGLKNAFLEAIRQRDEARSEVARLKALLVDRMGT